MKHILQTSFLFGFVFLLSGCTLPTRNTAVTLVDMSGGVIKSTDRGQTYAPAVKVDDKSTLASVETLALAMDKNDANRIYLGSLSDGIWITKDGGGSWVKSNVPITKNYAIVLHPTDANIAYTTGVYNGRGKVAKTTDAGVTWKEIYTEPADGTVILSLALNAGAPDTVYAGTSAGVIVVTHDGGATWGNLFTAQKPIRSLSVDTFDGNIVYAMAFQDSMLLSRDRGKTFVDMKSEWSKKQEERKSKCASGDTKCNANTVTVGSVQSYALDAVSRGTGYVGTDKGLFRFTEYGQNWEEINIIASSKAFPITTVAVSPKNPGEFYYNSAQAIYRTTDGGSSWFPFQIESDKASVTVMVSDWNTPGVLYAGLRKKN